MASNGDACAPKKGAPRSLSAGGIARGILVLGENQAIRLRKIRIWYETLTWKKLSIKTWKGNQVEIKRF